MRCGVKKKEKQGKRSRWGKKEERNLPWRSALTGGGTSVRAYAAVVSGGASDRAGPYGGAVLWALESGKKKEERKKSECREGRKIAPSPPIY